MKPQTSAFLDKSRDLLGQANTMQGVGLYEAAGRTAYLAGLHAAQALIFERTSKIIRRHRGVHGELRRVTQDEPLFGDDLRAFLGQAYNLKSTADYETGEARVTIEEVQEAIRTARRFVDTVAGILA